MAKKKTKKRSYDFYKKWGLAFLLALFILFAYLATSYIQTKNSLLFPRVGFEMKRYEKNYNAKVFDKKDLSVWWVSSDNLNIINDNSSGVELRVYDCIKDPEDRPAFRKIAQELGEKIDKISQEGGFVLNLRNSSKDIKDERFYDYIKAYEKENKKCVFVASPDCGAIFGEGEMHYSFSFACTDKFDENYNNQSPYLKDLNIKNAIVHVDKRVDNFIKLNVNYRRTGIYTLAELENNKWKELFSGQDYPPCEVINRYQIPKQIAPKCL